MADPASLFSIISGTVGLVAQCSRTICTLHTISERFKYAKLTVDSMSLGLETIQWAWTRIGIIMESWANEHEVWQDEMDDLIAQINRSLSGGTLVLSALEQDLKPYDTTSEHAIFGLRTRVKVLWNEQTLRDHQERLRDQVNSMNLLLNVLRLPEATARKNLLAEGQGVFHKSDESAYSIVPSRAPDSIRNRFSRLSSMKSEKSLAYHELSIDDDLFTARVYKRNYRTTAMIRKMFHSHRQSYASQGLPRVEDTNVPQFSSPEQEPRREETCLLEIGSTSGTYYPAEMLGLQSTNINTFKGLPELSTGVDAQPEFWKPTKWIVGIKKQRTIEGPPSSPALLHAGWKERTKRNDNSPPDLTSAVENGDIALFKDLLQRWNCIPGLWLHHCLMTACAQGREDLARLLLNYPVAIPAVDGLEKLYGASSPIKLAIRRRDLGIVKLLLQDPQTRHSCRSMDFLFIAAAIELDDAPFLQHTIDYDANIHQEISVGSQAVHLACQHRSFLCLGILIKAGASLTIPDQNGICAIGYLLWNHPSRELYSSYMPLLPSERQQAIQAVLGPEAMATNPSTGPEYTWAYGEAIRAIARTVLRKPRYFVEFIYCNRDVIASQLPLTMARPEILVAMETLEDLLQYGNFPLPSPEARPLFITHPSG